VSLNLAHPVGVVQADQRENDSLVVGQRYASNVAVTSPGCMPSGYV